jgi:heme/copper-type cytochrome/quinol oxidase subunit 2
MSGQGSNKSLLQKLTPACANLAKRSTMLNSIGVFFAIVSIILIIIALVYTYMDAGGDEAKAKTNRQVAGGLIIATLFTVVVTALVGVWQIIVNKTLAKCITDGTSGQSTSSGMM